MKQPQTDNITVGETGLSNETANKLAPTTTVPAAGGLRMRTDLRAGLAWDDLDDKAQELWGNLTATLSNLTGGGDAS